MVVGVRRCGGAASGERPPRGSFCRPGALRVYPRLRLTAALTASGRLRRGRGCSSPPRPIDRTPGRSPLGSRARVMPRRAFNRRRHLTTRRPRSRRALTLSKELGTRFFAPSAELVLAAVALLRGKISGIGRRRRPLRGGSRWGLASPVGARCRRGSTHALRRRAATSIGCASQCVPLDEPEPLRHCRLLWTNGAAGWWTRVALDMGVAVLPVSVVSVPNTRGGSNQSVARIERLPRSPVSGSPSVAT